MIPAGVVRAWGIAVAKEVAACKYSSWNLQASPPRLRGCEFSDAVVCTPVGLHAHREFITCEPLWLYL